MKNAQRIYDLLLKLYPRGYRKAFGAQMMQTFLDSYADVEESEGCVGMTFWFPAVTDEIKNITGQYMTPFIEENTFLRVSAPKLVLSATLLLPLFVVFYAAFVRMALALPHPPVYGLGVLLALGTLVLLPGVFSVIASYLIASAVAHLFSGRGLRIAGLR